MREHHRFPLQLLLRSLNSCENEILPLDCRIDQYLEPYAEMVRCLDRIPGVDRIGAAVILAEIGPDMRPWEEARKLAGLSGRRGKQRGVLVVAHTLLTVIYHMLNNPGLEFQDLGEDFFDKRDAQYTASRRIRRLEKLGYQVSIAPRTA